MKLHYIQHVPFEGPGAIARWAESRGHDFTATHVYNGETVPGPWGLDWLIVMGGPMGTADEGEYPWLAAEKRRIREAIEAGKVVIGICLGAQLVAEALGAKVFTGPEREIGWFPVTFAPAAKRFLGGPPKEMEVLHWHGDTFELPPGTEHLAASQAYANQAFVSNKRVFGFQFHLEVTEEGARKLVENCGDEIGEGAHMQSPEEIMADAGRFTAINRQMDAIFDHIAEITG